VGSRGNTAIAASESLLHRLDLREIAAVLVHLLCGIVALVLGLLMVSTFLLYNSTEDIRYGSKIHVGIIKLKVDPLFSPLDSAHILPP